MRLLAVAAVVCLVGCGGGHSMTNSDAPNNTCPKTCESCPSGESCLISATVAAACRATCHTADDCGPGLVCVGVGVDAQSGCSGDSFDFDARPRYCVPPDAPSCPGTDPGAIFDGEHCDATDQNVLATSYHGAYGCALKYTRCQNGCSPGHGIEVKASCKL